ncbi:MAG: CopD family protein [Gemmatimonadota bacterium]|nr:CopD family protein [Gemmatimonadota bacterium]
MTLYVLTTFQQFALFVGVVIAVGCVAWSLVIAPRAERLVAESERAGLVRVERGVGSVGLLAASALVGGWLLRGIVQLMAFRDPFVPLGEDVSFLLFDVFWGTVWMGQGALVILLVPAFAFARPRVDGEGSGGSWWAAGVLTLAIVASLSLSSHAMGVESGRPLIVTADALHLLTAGSWIGSLALILAVGRRGGRPVYAAQLQSFSPVAVVSVTTLTVMGVVLAWTHLVTPSDLWTGTYGRVLSAKVVTACLVFALGFLNWRKGLPAVETEEGAADVHRRAAFEVSVAVGVLLLTAVLVHSPKP